MIGLYIERWGGGGRVCVRERGEWDRKIVRYTERERGREGARPQLLGYI